MFRSNGLFSSRSPIEMGEEPTPEIQDSGSLARRLRVLSARLRNLLRAREDANKVHSAGYFETHYPKADERLKKLLHEKVMLAHSRALNNDMESEESEESKEDKPLSITISVGR